MQYRLTKKFAVDCRIESLSTPCNTMSPLDDWFIDVFRVNRKKVAMVTHAISTYTFFVPYAEVGGARMIPGHINKLLTDFLYRENFTQHLDELERLAKSNIVYCKTVDRKILGHMNDFKRCVSFRLEENPTDFEGAEKMIAQIPVNIKSLGYTTPLDRMRELLNNYRKMS
ncbi:MAG: hypothetical protein CMF38_04820 [Legionellaceae bacterium]|nr:hypothetical protein [Legionellaceae bacterium]